MARRSKHKGIPSRRSLDRAFPYQVVFEVPPGGMPQLRAMVEFCARHELKHTTMGGERPPPPRQICVYSFATEREQAVFHAEFGGERKTAEV